MSEYRLSLQDIELRLLLGLLPEERLAPTTVHLDLEWSGRLEPGNPPVDYSLVCSALAGIGGADFRYIEDVAAAVLELLTASWPGRWRVSASKYCPPGDLPMKRAVCTLEGEGD